MAEEAHNRPLEERVADDRKVSPARNDYGFGARDRRRERDRAARDRVPRSGDNEYGHVDVRKSLCREARERPE